MSIEDFMGPFSKATYVKRRKNLVKKLEKRSKSYIALFWSGSEIIRNQDAHFPFRAHSDFLYLSGFAEPESLLVLDGRGRKAKAHLFLRERDLSPDRGSEIWEGERLGVKRAKTWLGVDEAHDVAELESELKHMMPGAECVFWRFGEFASFDHDLIKWVNGARNSRMQVSSVNGILDPSLELHSLRKTKSKEEIAWMRKAAWVAAQGHIRAMKTVRSGMNEFEVQAEAEREFRKNGAEAPAYNSICASGNNASTLHYTQNNQLVEEGDLILMDAGAELRGYASDITRCFPANGRFSEAQRDVYNWVLKAQLAAIRAVKPGSAWDKPHQEAVKVIAKALRALGVSKATESEILKKKIWRRYMPHGTSHWIGLDVHDVGDYFDKNNKPLKLEVGNVLTIEPGLYFRKDDRSVPKRLRGIGVRIEDDVAVSSKGHDVLSLACPKTVEEIEALARPRM